MSYLQCIHLFKKRNDFTLDISFSIEKNSFVSIVGPSGSGKSTILRIIAGLTDSDSTNTKIILDNDDITKVPPGKRKCGMCFQTSSLFLNMNVQDNVGYGLRCKGISKKESRKQAVDFLKIFEMEDFARRSPETLSGGEAQRVSLARTLIVQPKLVLLDEPLSALDENLRKNLAEEIKKMQEKIGFTAIMVTHDLNEAKLMSDRIIAIKDGTKKWEGKSENFTSQILFQSSSFASYHTSESLLSAEPL
ncbi:MAG: ABC transporter ATP-binding protein [Treponema sp.]|nr:ABC transporter ATP-binding protein [Treponema sp.]